MPIKMAYDSSWILKQWIRNQGIKTLKVIWQWREGMQVSISTIQPTIWKLGIIFLTTAPEKNVSKSLLYSICSRSRICKKNILPLACKCSKLLAVCPASSNMPLLLSFSQGYTKVPQMCKTNSIKMVKDGQACVGKIVEQISHLHCTILTKFDSQNHIWSSEPHQE